MEETISTWKLAAKETLKPRTLYNQTIEVGAESVFIDNVLDADLAIIFALCILIAFEAVRYITFGPLRTIERQHLAETSKDYFYQKFLFLAFTLDYKYLIDLLPWTIWFMFLGSILLLSKLCKDRFEHLSSSPAVKRWPLIKIAVLMASLLLITTICNTSIPIGDFSTHSLFLSADSLYVLIFVLSVITRMFVLSYNSRPDSVLENSAPIDYYSDLLFSMTMLSIELLHHSHLLIVRNSAFVIRVVCLMKIHTLLMEIRRRYRRHKHHLLVGNLIESSFAIASEQEIRSFNDECAICWDGMKCARKLPCGHLFHNSCLRSWLEQDTSCPTCRTSFKGHQQHQQPDDLNEIVDDHSDDEEEFIETARTHQRNHFFHFDSSRYTNYPLLSWLPTISIEGFL